MNKIIIPADVPKKQHALFKKRYEQITQKTGRLFLFAGDQRVEHLNDDFFGRNIAKDDADPEHLFKIASSAKIGAFATQLGMIARYGQNYKNIPYIVKLNSKTNLIPKNQADPLSSSWYNVRDVIAFQKTSGLNIAGIGYTIFPGSVHESIMLREAAQAIFEAHQNGLIATLWIYPRGQAVKNERDVHLLAGMAGLGLSLGADFIKLNPPQKIGSDPAYLLENITRSAGNSKIICAGGESANPHQFLSTIYSQINIGKTAGVAIGRNIHQKPLAEAIHFANAIHSIIIDNKTPQEAFLAYQQ